jgi:hypothetical protein
VALAGALLAPLALAGCSGGGADDDGATLGSTEAPAPPSVPDIPAPAATGTGVVVVGRTSSSFAVTSCLLTPDPTAPTAARAMVELAGAGTTASGVPFTIEVQRFATGADVVTFTDTVTYADSGRILQAQRIEVNGEVTDLRDARAATALLRTRADGVSAAGLAGPPGGSATDDGLIGIALDATC